MKNRKHTLNRILSVIAAFLAVLIILAFMLNIYQNSKLTEMKVIYRHKANEMAEIAASKDPQAIIMVNDDTGLWDKKEGNKVRIKLEMAIDQENDNPDYIFTENIRSIIADDDGNIYVADYGQGSVLKFDEQGKYLTAIGQTGRGPGEFSSFTQLGFDNTGNLLIYDHGNKRLDKFSKQGRYINSIHLALKGSCRGIALDDSGYIYISSYDTKNEMTLHKFSPSGEKVVSFAEAVEIRKKNIIPADLILLSDIAAGSFVIYEKKLFSTRVNPYEIRVFDFSGSLLKAIYRKNNFMIPSYWKPIRVHNEPGYVFCHPARSTCIGIWEEKIVNCIYLNPLDEDNKIPGTVVDVYGLDGYLLTSLHVSRAFEARYVNTKGQIFGLEKHTNQFLRIVRYRLFLLLQ